MVTSGAAGFAILQLGMTHAAQPPPSPDGFARCQECRALVAGDQRYCLQCGAALRGLEPAAQRVPVRTAPSWRERLAPAGGARGAAAALACALGVGVLLGALAGATTPGSAAKPRVIVMASTAAPTSATSAAADGSGSLASIVPPPPVAPPPVAAPPPPPPPPPATPDTSASTPAKKKKKAQHPAAGTSGSAQAKPTPAPIKHVVVIALADKGFAEAFGAGSRAPFLATELRKQAVLLRRYHATAHGSLPNLIGLLSGQASNPAIAGGCAALTPFVIAGPPAKDGQVRGAGCVFPASVPTLPAQLEAKKLTWRGYVEGADPPPGTPPAPCMAPAPGPDGTPAVIDRNPFLFFAALAGAADCTARVTGFGSLATDVALAPAQAPALSVILPGPCLAGREGACPAGEPDGLARADAWLRELVPQLLAAPAYTDDTMIVITFDQARATGRLSDFASCCVQARGVNEPESVDPQAPAEGGGRVGALVLSPKARAGAASNVPYNHFALLRTIEDAFGLDAPALAGADDLTPFGGDVFRTAN